MSTITALLLFSSRLFAGIPLLFSSSNPLESSNLGHEREMDDSFLVDLDNEDELLEADNDVVEHMKEDVYGDLADIKHLTMMI